MADGGIAGLRIDITALKRAQEALRESQVMLNRAQKLSGTGSVVRNLATKATEWSDEMYRIFGVERGVFEARTENFLALIHPEDRRGSRSCSPRAEPRAADRIPHHPAGRHDPLGLSRSRYLAQSGRHTGHPPDDL